MTEKDLAALNMPLVNVLEIIQQQKKEEDGSVLGKTALIKAIPTLFRKAVPTLNDLIKTPMKVIADVDKVEFGIIQGLVGFITRNGIVSKRWNWRVLTAIRKGSRKKSFKFPTTSMDRRPVLVRSHGLSAEYRQCRIAMTAMALA